MNGGISAPFIRYPIATSLLMAASCLSASSPIRCCRSRRCRRSTSRPSSRRQPAGRHARNHGLVGGAAAGAAVRANPRHRADDLDEFAGRDRGHHPVRPQPQHRRRRQRRPGRDQRRQRPVAEEPAHAADLSQGQPGGLADPAAVGDIGHVAPITEVDDATDNLLAQQISQISGVAQVRIGGQQKPAIRVQIDPAKLVAKGLSLEDVRTQIATRRSTARKALSTACARAYTIYRQRSTAEAKDWNDVIIAYRNGGPLRIRDIGTGGHRPRKTPSRRPGPTASAACSWWSSSSPAPTSSTPSTRSRRCCRGWSAAIPAGDQDQRHQRPHPDHPRRGRGRAVHAAA